MNVMLNKRFCINCKHYSSYLGSAMCHRKMELDLVSGEEKPLFCIVERKYDTEDSCGLIGKFWERKEYV